MVLLFFIASGLLFFTIAHSRIVRARNYRWLKTGEMRQDLVRYLHDFREKVFSTQLKEYQFPETEFFTPQHFPLKKMESGHEVAPTFRYYHLTGTGFPEAEFTRTRLTAAFEVAHAEAVGQGGHPYRCRSETVIDFLNGDIPLMFFPVFVQLTLGETVTDAEYFEKKNVVNLSGPNPVTEDTQAQTKLEFDGIIRGSFDIPAGEVILWPDIRRKLGMEPSPEPLDEGIYIVVEGPWVRALFVQGDVDAIVFFVIPDDLQPVQGVRIIRPSMCYEVYYKPGREYFLCPDPAIGTDKFFHQRIIVNGSIHSLTQEGEAAFCPLTRLMLLASGQVVIHSGLETAGGKVDLGSVTLANLTLAAGFDSDPSTPAVTVETTKKTKIRASIVADGTFENKSPELKLEGSLYCRDIQNQGKIEVTHRETGNPDSAFFKVLDYKFVYQFIISFIEEVSVD